MIEPPAFYTEKRQEYDLADLEQLGSVAIKLDIHTHPYIKLMFAQLVDLVGTPAFSSSVYPLSEYLSSLLMESRMEGTFSNWYALHPSACEEREDGIADKFIEEDVIIESFSVNKGKKSCLPAGYKRASTEKLNRTVDALMAANYVQCGKEDPEISFKNTIHSLLA